ncbi:hypothetical protein A2U01_0063478, partial [Trifolium medium]|nr:hypothetical protein [Trifolium medium]
DPVQSEDNTSKPQDDLSGQKIESTNSCLGASTIKDVPSTTKDNLGDAVESPVQHKEKAIPEVDKYINMEADYSPRRNSPESEEE